MSWQAGSSASWQLWLDGEVAGHLVSWMQPRLASSSGRGKAGLVGCAALGCAAAGGVLFAGQNNEELKLLARAAWKRGAAAWWRKSEKGMELVRGALVCLLCSSKGGAEGPRRLGLHGFVLLVLDV